MQISALRVNVRVIREQCAKAYAPAGCNPRAGIAGQHPINYGAILTVYPQAELLQARHSVCYPQVTYYRGMLTSPAERLLHAWLISVLTNVSWNLDIRTEYNNVLNIGDKV